MTLGWGACLLRTWERAFKHTPPPPPPPTHKHTASLSLKTPILKPQGKAFIYNEFALGGGISECGDTPAKTRAEAGRFSWLGGTSTYNWNINPWKDPVISQYNKDW